MSQDLTDRREGLCSVRSTTTTYKSNPSHTECEDTSSSSTPHEWFSTLLAFYRSLRSYTFSFWPGILPTEQSIYPKHNWDRLASKSILARCRQGWYALLSVVGSVSLVRVDGHDSCRSQVSE